MLHMETHLATCREVTSRFKAELFDDRETVVVGTGGFARLYENESLFDELISELVLKGLYSALEMNT